ncbi:hypothetical protein [Cellvibrio sp. OA-2007]|uniref:hypothetical protein n=1 Tax=Cellvibrio sp. OA-2007 TaxID=529823 RepID=UPI00193107B1|nr:hypothetical protein [Cellvibrio sp. OA-2007]
MHNYPRFTINRHLIILMPKQPVLDWIKRVDPNPPDITLEELRLEQNAFLVPDALDGQQDAEKWVQRRWQMFFEGFLEEWYTVESWWPQKRTYKMFKDWFDVQYHSMVWDLATSEPISYEDWDSPNDEVPLS